MFKGKNDAEALLKVQQAQVPKPRKIRSEIPVGLEKIIFKALSVDPRKRYKTADDMAEALEELLVSSKKAVGRRHLGDMMDRVFYEQKKFKDAQINHVLQKKSLPAMQGAGMVSGTDASLEMPTIDHTGVSEAPKRSMILVVAAAAFFALVMGVLAIVGFYRSRAPAKSSAPAGAKKAVSRKVATRKPASQPMAPVPRKPETRPAPRIPGTVTLTVVVKPRSAAVRVTFRGKTYFGSRLRLMMPRSDKMESLTLAARGYYSENLVLVPLEDSTTTVTLKRRRIARRMGPMTAGPAPPRPEKEGKPYPAAPITVVVAPDPRAAASRARGSDRMPPKGAARPDGGVAGTPKKPDGRMPARPPKHDPTLLRDIPE